MAKHSITEAAKITGKSRSTIHRHIKIGKISKEISKDGSPVIDTSELQRAYGALSHQDSADTVSMTHPKAPVGSNSLIVEIEALRRENDMLRDDRDRWAAQAESLTRLLTHEKPPRGSFLSRLLRRD